MPGISELDLMKTIDAALSKTDDVAMRTRILRWAWEKHASGPAPDAMTRERIRSKPKRAKKKFARAMKRGSGKQAVTLSLDKNLNLQPKNKRSFAKFVEEKKPVSNLERCLLSVYYLQRTLDVDGCTGDRVYTCFKDRKWRVPPDLRNTLREAASRFGWLDTRDRNNVSLTTRGENYVEYDLPKKDKKRQ